MKKHHLVIIFLLCFIGFAGVQKDDGRAGATGSPGETTCNTSGCHTGNSLNVAGGSIQIAAPTMPGWVYFPGQTYPIQVSVSKTGTNLFGFGFEALRSTGANGGTLTITNSAQTQIKSVVIGGNVRNNVVHQLNGGASPNSHVFSFNWTAPAAGTGNVTLYAAGNAANGNGTSSGDFIYTTSQIVTESPVGINEINNGLSSISVYPNPASEKFHVDFNTTQPATVEFTLLSFNGKKVQTVTAEFNIGGSHTFEMKIDESLSAGLYILQLNTGEFTTTHKVFVNR